MSEVERLEFLKLLRIPSLTSKF